MEALPSELLLNIFFFLPPEDVCRLQRSCKYFYSLCGDRLLWQRFYLRRWPSPSLERSTKRITKEKYQRRVVSDHIWKETVPRMSVIPMNCEVSCLRLSPSEDTIISANGVAVIEERDVISRHDLRASYKGHTGWVYDLQGDERMIVSGADDKTIRVWERKREDRGGGELQVLRGHTGGLRCLQFTGNNLVSGSWDKTLRFWDLERGVCTSTIAAHDDSIWCLQQTDECIYSGSKDLMIKAWDPRAGGRCVSRLVGHEGWVYCLQSKDRDLVSGCGDCTWKAWDLRTARCLKTLAQHTAEVFDVAMTGRRVITASGDRTMRVWDRNTFECLRVLNGHEGEVTSIGVMSRRRIVSASWDASIRVWDFGAQEKKQRTG